MSSDEKMHHCREVLTRIEEAVAIRRKISAGKTTIPEIIHQDSDVIALARALNSASNAFCVPETSSADDQFFEEALALAKEGSSRSLENGAEVQPEDLESHIPKNCSPAETVDIILNRSKYVILRQQEEIFCLRLMVRELLHGMLRPGYENKNDYDTSGAAVHVSPESGVAKQARGTPSTVNTTFTSTTSSTLVSKASSSGMNSKNSLAEVQRSLYRGADTQEETERSTSGHSPLLNWHARHAVKNHSPSVESQRIIRASEKTQASVATESILDNIISESVDRANKNNNPLRESALQKLSQNGISTEEEGKASTLSPYAGESMPKDPKPGFPSSHANKATNSDSGMRGTLSSGQEIRGMNISEPAILEGGLADQSRDSVPHIFEDDADDGEQVLYDQGQRRMLVLLSGKPLNRAQHSMQERALSILDENGIYPDLVDGADPGDEVLRDSLFDLSGLRGIYPQFFLVEDDGMTEFFGDFQTVVHLDNAAELRSVFWRLSNTSALDISESQLLFEGPAGSPRASAPDGTAATLGFGGVPYNGVHGARKDGNMRRTGNNARSLVEDSNTEADTTANSSFSEFNDGNRALRWV